MSMDTPQVLVIGIARIGDTLLMTPCLRAIKTALPEAELTVFAHPKRCAVLENFEPIDRLVGTTKRHVPLKGWLPGKAYDVALVYGRDAALLNYALRVSKKVFCFDERAFVSIRSQRLEKVALPVTPIHAVDERMLLIDAWLGSNNSPHNRRLGLTLTEAERQSAAGWLMEKGVSQHPLIGLQACSFPTKAHRDWPAANFHALVAAVLVKYPSAQFLILGDDVAAEKGRLFKEAFPSHITIAAGQMSLRQSAALMSCLDLYVGVDTGPTHMAGALGIPMVAMYHHQYPGRNLMPLDNPLCKVIEHPLTAHPVDRKMDHGMDQISVEEVTRAALNALQARFQTQAA